MSPETEAGEPHEDDEPSDPPRSIEKPGPAGPGEGDVRSSRAASECASPEIASTEGAPAGEDAGASPSAGTSPSAEPASRPDASGRTKAMGNVLAVGSWTLLSRVTGLFREMSKAYFLGTGLAADAYDVAIRIPNLLRALVAEGAVSAAIVPVFTRYAHRGEETRVASEKLLTLWAGLVAIVGLVGVFLAGTIVALCFQAGSFADPEKLDLTSDLTRVLFAYLFLIGVAACLQGILHSHAQFALPSAAPFLFNFTFLVVVWALTPFFDEPLRVWAFAVAVIVGGAVQLAVMIPPVWRIGVRFRPRWPFDHPGVRRALRLLVPATFGAGIYQVNVMVNTVIAGRFEEGQRVAALTYSSRLMELVLGIFVFALNTVSLTEMSSRVEAGDRSGYAATLEELLRLAIFVTVPSAVGLFVLREHVVSLLFLGGQFDATSLALTAGALAFHAFGMIFVGLSRGLVSGFYALKDVRTPVRIAAINLLVNVVLAWTLSRGALEFRGIALAGTLAALVQVLLLGAILARRVERIHLFALLSTSWRTLLASAAMGGVVWLGARRVDPIRDGKPLLALAVFGLVLVGAWLYFTVARLAGLREGTALLSPLRAVWSRLRSRR